MTRITGFYALYSVQFLLITCKIFMDVKVGLFSLILTMICLMVTFLQLSRETEINWSAGKNGMLGLYSLWTVYCLLEVFNPNNLMESWNICMLPYALLPLICAFIVPVVIRDKKGLEVLLFIWSAFILIATLKGYWQKSHGFSERDRYFLYALGGWRTHVIWSGVRYFSCFSDASAYGIHCSMAVVTFTISAFYMKEKWKRFYFLFVALCAIYGFGISGTRSAMAVIVGGLMMQTLISKNIKAVIISGITLSMVFCFFYFTEIGNSNPFIFKMRSAFHPLEDASYMVRVENREKMKELMSSKPIGYGIGRSKVNERVDHRDFMPFPPDSWLVSVWVETGIVGLVIYILVNGTLFIWCIWILMMKVKDKQLRGLGSAWLCMNAGFFLGSYAADTLQYPNTIVVYTGFAVCFAILQIDRNAQQISKSTTNSIVT